MINQQLVQDFATIHNMFRGGFMGFYHILGFTKNMGYTTKGLTVDDKKLYVYVYIYIYVYCSPFTYMGFNNQHFVNILWIYQDSFGVHHPKIRI